jgi:hypothetical protein
LVKIGIGAWISAKFSAAPATSGTDYTDAEAINWGHLGAAWAVKLTDRLHSLVRTFPVLP